MSDRAMRDAAMRDAAMRDAAMRDADERAWAEWLAWLPTAPPSDGPMPLFARFRASLLDAGVPADEVGVRLRAVQRLMRERTDGWRAMFDVIYASATPGFRTAPNALLVDAVRARAPGDALDVGTGQGRNALFLALQGWAVTGFDVSDTGLAIAARDAERAGVALTLARADGRAFDYGVARWDLVVATYEPLPLTDAAFVARLHAALRPGGLLVIESFASDADAPKRRPVDVDPAALRGALAPFAIRRFEDLVTVADWDETEARVVRAVAEKG